MSESASGVTSCASVFCVSCGARYGVALNVPELEQRLSNLQSQVERLWQRTEQNVPVEQRLSKIADEYAEYLKRWANTVERHTGAVAQIEEPVKELRGQAASLTAICIATASAQQQGFDRAESRLASFEGNFHDALSEITRELRTVVAEIKARHDHPSARLDGAAPWAFDDVTHLHSKLRDPSGVDRPAGNSLQVHDRPALSDSREFLPTIAGDVQDDRTRARAPSPRGDEEGSTFKAVDLDREQPIPRKWRVAVVCLGLAVIVVSAFGWRLYNQVRVGAQRVQQAELESARAAALAASQSTAAREEAAREIASAREMATSAQRISNVLAAPDLVRYNLAGNSAAPRASGQALWSRSRGLVFSGSGIPPAPPDGHHQVWLLTRVAPVKAGTFVLEADGAVTSVQHAPFVPRAVTGVMVTLEGTGGGEAPSGDTVLTSMQSVE